jgi:hypothetical protein
MEQSLDRMSIRDEGKVVYRVLTGTRPDTDQGTSTNCLGTM